MKKISVITVFLIILNCNLFAQNYNWITPNKNYLKVYVGEDAVYRINRNDFLSAGINPDIIDPRTVKVLFKGNQVPVYFYGEQDGVFNDSDYFDFYGERNYGGLTNVYEESGGYLNVSYTLNEYFNLYSDTNIYWIDWGGNFGLRYKLVSNPAVINYPQNYFYEKIHFEKDLIYSLGEKRNPFDYRYFNNERVLGEGWFWRELARGNSISDTSGITDIPTSASQSYVRLFAYPNSYTDSIFNEHRLILRVNSNYVDTLKRDNYNRFDTTISFPTSFLVNSGINQISFTYTNPLNYGGRIYFDMFELSYPKKFNLIGNKLSANLEGNDTSFNIFKVSGFNAANHVNIYDVRNYERIINYSSSADTLIFSGRKNGKFEIVNNFIDKKPFRIKKRIVPNLVSNQTGADYLIVYNKLFESQAEQLRNHRENFNNFRTFKAEVEDINDIFNYGIENPAAIRNFVRNVYNNWTAPKVKYLCLFGRGSLDPKKNLSNSIFYENLLSVYGNPPTDGYFANFNEGSHTYYHQIAVGRIPVYNVSEAQNIVNKIIGYDNTQPDKWIKNFIYITGGQNLNEQIQFANQSNSLINSFINPPPVSGINAKIYRNDSSGYITYNYQDSIINSINSGGLIVNYIGHAATNVWDNGLEEPSDLNNTGKLPVVFSMTCFTGRNSETNERSFGEKFLYIPLEGAIGFIGSTGWSFSGSGNQYNLFLYQGFSSDSVRMLGDLLKFATYKMSPDSLSFPVRNTINCYNLIGDPASKLLLPVHPEFDIQGNDFWISNPYPALKEEFVFKIFPKNLGTYADSNKIRFLILKNGLQIYLKDTVIKNVRYIDTLTYITSLDSAGSYAFKIVLDPDNWYTSDSKINNTAVFPVLLRNISFVPLKPVDNIELQSDSVEFTGLNPNVDFNQNSVRVILQIDTSKNFNSPVLKTYFKNVTGGVFTKFIVANLFRNSSKSDIKMNSSSLYFWRMNSVINNSDSSGWSEVRKILLSNEKVNKLKIQDTIIKVTKNQPGQYSITELDKIEYVNSGFELKKFSGNLVAQSWGGYFYDATYFTINESQIFFIDSAQWGGIHIAKVRKLDGKLSELKHFTYSSSLSNDSLFNYLEAFDTNYVLMAVKSIPTLQTQNFNTAVRNKFKQFGSIYIDSVNLQSTSKWSFISYRGLPQPLVSEAFERINYIPVIASMNPEFKFSQGKILSVFGPSDNWKELKHSYQTFQNSGIKYDLYGINREGIQVPLTLNKNITEIINIDTLNTLMYPSIKIYLNFEIDTNNLILYESPKLFSQSVLYNPPAELIPDNNSVVVSDSIIQEGDTLSISFLNYNPGYVTSNESIYKWYANTAGGIIILRTDTLNSPIKVDSFQVVSSLISTKGLKNPNYRKDTVFIFCETSNSRNEFYYYNNTVVSKVIIEGDSLKPLSDITFDGIKVNNGDFIQRKPQIILKFYDNSPVFINDTSNIKIKLNNIYIPYFTAGVKNPELDIQFMGDNYLQAIVTYTPNLGEGEHKFEFISVDANGNRSDSIRYFLNVTSEFRIVDLYNYPNPMKNNTSFIFNISGEYPPSKCKIRIFSVAGKLIKTIECPANIGFNQFDWDGRDSDGDYIANGIYFYKLIIEGDSKFESRIEKIAVLK